MLAKLQNRTQLQALFKQHCTVPVSLTTREKHNTLSCFPLARIQHVKKSFERENTF